MNRFEVKVTGIERKEYFQACRLNATRLYKILGVTMVLFCSAIIAFTDNYSPKAIIWPIVIYVLCVAGWEILYRASYKGQLENLEEPVCYDITPKEWKVQNGQTTNTVNWKGTVKLKKTSLCYFLYDNDASSNLLPRRLLDGQKEELLEKWFQESRQEAKAYQKKQLRKERQEFRDSHPGLRLGRSGPMWGPFRRR